MWHKMSSDVAQDELRCGTRWPPMWHKMAADVAQACWLPLFCMFTAWRLSYHHAGGLEHGRLSLEGAVALDDDEALAEEGTALR